MDLFDIKLRLGVSRSHSRRNKLNILNVYKLRILKALTAQFYLKALLRADRLHSNCLNYPVNQETCKVHNLLQSAEVSNYHLSFVLLITRKISSFTVKRFFSCLDNMSKDGGRWSKDVAYARNESRCNTASKHLGKYLFL